MLLLAALVAAGLAQPAGAQAIADSPTYDDTLAPYAVGIAKWRIFETWTGYGIWLGGGTVLTAAHVVGRFPFLTHPRVTVDGQELEATIVKRGSANEIDLALLVVAERDLPMRLALRRTRLCTAPLAVGQAVVVVDIKGVARSRVLSPRIVPPAYRRQFGTVIATLPVVGQSGSGVFDPQGRCLAGLITHGIRRTESVESSVGAGSKVLDVARRYIPAATIAAFLPPGYRF